MNRSASADALEGLTILVTRPRDQARTLVEALRTAQAHPIELPAIAIEPPASFEALDGAIRRGGYDWVIFTSANGVESFFRRLALLDSGPEWFRGVSVAVIGPATARSLDEHGVTADLVPEEYVAEALVACLSDGVALAGRRVLLPRADIARDALVKGLIDAGAAVDAVEAYRTVPAPAAPEVTKRLRDGLVDVVTFTSPSTVRAVISMLGADAVALERATIACIGPITAAAARQAGLDVKVVATTYTAQGLVAALRTYYSHQQPGIPIGRAEGQPTAAAPQRGGPI